MTQEKITLARLEIFRHQGRRHPARQDGRLRVQGIHLRNAVPEAALPTSSTASASKSVIQDFAHLKDRPELLAEILEDKTSYGDIVFVPMPAPEWFEAPGRTVDERSGPGPQGPQARHRQHAQQGHCCCGRRATAHPADRLKSIVDFTAVKGRTKIPDQNWKDLLDHFNQPRFVQWPTTI